MLFNQTNNGTLINIFNILVEIIIIFSVFAVFFGIFINYFLINYYTSLFGKFIKKSISYYKPIFLSYIKNSNILYTYLIDKIDLQQLQQQSDKEENDVNNYNTVYDNRLLIIIFTMIGILLTILIIPILLGIIPINQLNLKFNCLSLFLHIILIIGLELIFFIVVLSYFNPIKIYKTLEMNKDSQGNYI